MRITHLGHSAVLVETDDARVLIDPGNFSDTWHSLTDLDAVLITHIHPDHADPEHLPALVRANSERDGVRRAVDRAGRGVGQVPRGGC